MLAHYSPLPPLFLPYISLLAYAPGPISRISDPQSCTQPGALIDLPQVPSYHDVSHSRATFTCAASSWANMRLKMETHVSGDVFVLHCRGRIVYGDEAAAFRERIKNILLGTNQIVVNLSGIEYIDSGGLGTLVGTLASTRNRHGEIKLVRPIQRVSDLLLRTRLQSVFKSYESDDEAVAAFRTQTQLVRPGFPV